MNQIFVEKDMPYTLQNGRNILAPKPKTTGYGIENARFLGSRIWHAMPSSIKESQTLNLMQNSPRLSEEKTVVKFRQVNKLRSLLFLLLYGTVIVLYYCTIHNTVNKQ